MLLHQRRPAALCLSGGGIRSATFGLGVLQALARVGVLGKLDYLSTVSGGGYVGGWLTSWLHREQRDKVLREMDPAQVGALRGEAARLLPRRSAPRDLPVPRAQRRPGFRRRLDAARDDGPEPPAQLAGACSRCSPRYCWFRASTWRWWRSSIRTSSPHRASRACRLTPRPSGWPCSL